MTQGLDLRTAPLDSIAAIDFRAPDRDFFADEAVSWGRFAASWADLPDDAWTVPGAAPSAAGGPDWSLLDHVTHIGVWQEVGVAYIERALAGGRWPSDDDFANGDLDAWNEEHRDDWAGSTPAEVRARVVAGHARLVDVARRVPPELLRTDDVYPWVYWVLHGHQLDHLRIIEPWVAKLRGRG